MNEVDTVNSFEADIENDSIDVSSMSDFELFQLSMAEKDPVAAEKIQEEQERLEQTYREIEAFYGNEIITYHDYQGTALEVAQKCPAAINIAKLGFDAFKDWVEANRTTQIIENPPDETLNESIEENDINEDKPKIETESDSKPLEDKKPIVSKEKDEVQKADDVTSEVQVVTSADVGVEVQKEEVPTENLKIEKVSKTKTPLEKLELSEFVDEAPTEPESTSSIEEHEESIDEFLAVSSEVVEEVFNVEGVQTPIEIETVPSVGTIESEAIVEPELANQPLAEIVESEVELNDEIEEGDIIETALDESIEVEEVITEQIADEVYDHFENWSEAAKEEPPLEDFIIEMIDALDVQLDTISDESIAKLEVESGSATLDINDVSDFFVHLEEIELPENDEVLEAFDQELRQEARVELVALLVSVKSARKTIDRLFEAKTKEECQVHLSELKVELMLILQSLGYENAEVIVQNFLKSHSPQALKNLINELEKSLRRAAYRTAHVKRVHRENTRYARLGKFIQFIMQAVTSKRTIDVTST